MPVIITHPETHAISNLQRGDLVFKNCEGSLEVGKVIQAGQFLSSLFGQAKIKDSKWEHAAVAINAEGSLIEAVSGGITVNDMSHGADYIVFHCTNALVRDVAANAAQMFLENKLEAEDEGSQIFGYSIKKAIKAWANPSRAVPDVDSVEARIDSLFPLLAPGQVAADPRDVFCSQFAALCYAIGAEQSDLHPGAFIERQDHVLTPAQMVTQLNKNLNWQFIGIRQRG
jgi:hypothetical protein